MNSIQNPSKWDPEKEEFQFSNLQLFQENQRVQLQLFISKFYFSLKHSKNNLENFVSIDSLTAISLSKLSSEFIIHLQGKNDMRFYSKDCREQIVQSFLIVKTKLLGKKNFRLFYISEISLEKYTGTIKNQSVVFRAKSAQINIIDSNYTSFFDPSLKLPSSQNSTQILYTQNNFKVSKESFFIEKMLGLGASGKVFLCSKKNSGNQYAMKIIKKAKIIQSKQFEKVKTEKTILSRFNHPFLVKLYYSFQSGSQIYFVIELMKGGDLFHHLKKIKRFSENQTKFIIACLITALGFLHNKDCLYRDLKPENILLDEKGYAKLSDFGLVKFLNNTDTASTFCGTPEYLAPERILDRGCQRSGDWWSLGILLYEMLYGSPPFYSKDKQSMLQKTILEKLCFNKNIQVSETAKNFIKKLLTKSPKKRLGTNGDALELMNHEWFQDFNWLALLGKVMKPEYVPINGEKNWLQNFDQNFLDEIVEREENSNCEMFLRFQKEFSNLDFDREQEEQKKSERKKEIEPFFTPKKERKKCLKYFDIYQKNLNFSIQNTRVDSSIKQSKISVFTAVQRKKSKGKVTSLKNVSEQIQNNSLNVSKSVKSFLKQF